MVNGIHEGSPEDHIVDHSQDNDVDLSVQKCSTFMVLWRDDSERSGGYPSLMVLVWAILFLATILTLIATFSYSGEAAFRFFALLTAGATALFGGAIAALLAVVDRDVPYGESQAPEGESAAAGRRRFQ